TNPMRYLSLMCVLMTIPAFAAEPAKPVAKAPLDPRPEKPVVKQGEDKTLTLLAVDATVNGAKAKLEKKGENPMNIGYWTNDQDTVTWRATLTAGGKFDVNLEYSLAPNSKGAEIAIEFGKDQKVAVPLEAGKSFLDFRTVKVGQVELAAGEVTVTVRPVKKPGVAVMDLRQIVLKPAK
ncbi:MAG: hypothetical protein ACAI43_21135, partial [Phycisphaerae bacterium]